MELGLPLWQPLTSTHPITSTPLAWPLFALGIGLVSVRAYATVIKSVSAVAPVPLRRKFATISWPAMTQTCSRPLQARYHPLLMTASSLLWIKYGILHDRALLAMLPFALSLLVSVVHTLRLFRQLSVAETASAHRVLLLLFALLLPVLHLPGPSDVHTVQPYVPHQPAYAEQAGWVIMVVSCVTCTMWLRKLVRRAPDVYPRTTRH
ncbi:hypothetical protein THASP1DRAFT_31267 [Thamnocephalis sphaerospora]|uniref:Uncharacterized protein n=1 Tax=Thamnocephalis sphaerospora TaxID=78915 RepID=A0A4P9XM13_9FUNG|nr:hypothetical protein THASP1DRAFT_31267 [Thamnocephalis sphaerospora]|eukprot:RKP06924.1 hypothetical protein THASP1DRAFT_31267 [Thamnocephalis sphaerospora]